MPLRKFNVPDEVILIYHDPDNENNSIVLRYFAGDIPDWVADIQIPVRDEQLVTDRMKGKKFKEIMLPETSKNFSSNPMTAEIPEVPLWPKSVITATGELIFLASPYSHDDPIVRYTRYTEVKKCTATLLARGISVYSPIVYSHQLLMLGAGRTDFLSWCDFNRAMVTRVSAMWILTLDGWKASQGIEYEIACCDSFRVSIFLVDPHSYDISQYRDYS